MRRKRVVRSRTKEGQASKERKASSWSEVGLVEIAERSTPNGHEGAESSPPGRGEIVKKTY